MHRDLNLTKIWIKREENNSIVAKLSGFECSSKIKLETIEKPKKASTLFKAPELLADSSGECLHDSKVDIWSLGISLFMLLSGAHPFTDKPKA